jgi:hypothetical protein
MHSRSFTCVRTPLLCLTVLGVATGCGMIDRMTGAQTACNLLAADGVSARAEVLSIWDTGWKVNEQPVIGLRVRVEPEDRPAYEAEIPKSVVSLVHIPQFQPGATVPVVFDRRNPAKVGLDVYECRGAKPPKPASAPRTAG